jgi:uncharacterized protein (TIGR02118 family)
MLELLALGSDPRPILDLAERSGGAAYVFHDSEDDRRPFSAMARLATDDIAAVEAAADVGLYVVFARVIKAPDGPAPMGRVIGAFGMVRHPDLDHGAADAHWRDRHGPLALASHSAMCDYTQLSVLATLSGRALDGMALCAFGSHDDLRHRFFDDDDARAAIGADVAQFADTRKSMRRVVLTQAVTPG